jgi:hypothetical protein
MKNTLTLIALSLLCSCATTGKGFDRDMLREQANGAPQVVTEKEIAETLKLKPQLPTPFRLGVYFKDEDRQPRAYGAAMTHWRWTPEDRSRVLSALEQIKNLGQISDVFEINASTIARADQKSVRLAAAQHGADAVLVVAGASDVDRHNNNWATTYVALLPALFVHGTDTDALFMGWMTLWDVRNGFLYATAESESSLSESTPAAFTHEQTLVDSAKEEALGKMNQELTSRLQRIILQANSKANAKAKPKNT